MHVLELLLEVYENSGSDVEADTALLSLTKQHLQAALQAMTAFEQLLREQNGTSAIVIDTMEFRHAGLHAVLYSRALREFISEEWLAFHWREAENLDQCGIRWFAHTPLTVGVEKMEVCPRDYVRGCVWLQHNHETRFQWEIRSDEGGLHTNAITKDELQKLLRAFP